MDAGTDGGAQVRHDEPPAPGPVAVVGPEGHVVAHGHAAQVHRAGDVHPAPEALQLAINGGLAGLGLVPGIGTVPQLLQIAHTVGCTVGVGIAGQAAFAVGLEHGHGVYYTPAGEIGAYHSVAADVGAIVGVGGEVVFTAVYGEASALAGPCWAVAIGGGEGVSVGLSALFTTATGHFFGVAYDFEVGEGAPVAAFAQLSDTRIVPWT
jgi:hypothetical protein